MRSTKAISLYHSNNWHIVDDPAEQDIADLDDRLNRFNLEESGVHDARYLSLFLRDESGNLIAGAHGYSWGGHCELKLLWVAAEHRGAGLGSNLLETVQREATARGCDRIVLSTYSFQAPDFYRRRGFYPVAEIADCPRGFSHLILVKNIAG